MSQLRRGNWKVFSKNLFSRLASTERAEFTRNFYVLSSSLYRNLIQSKVSAFAPKLEIVGQTFVIGIN